MSGKAPRHGTSSPAQGATRPQARSRSALSDRSESPGHSEWKNNAERCKTGAKPAGRELAKTNSGSAKSTGGQTPRSSQKTPRSGSKTPRTPRSRTPRSGTPTSGMSDDGTGARLPLYMQPTYASMNKSRKPPPRSATFHSRGVSSEEAGTRRGAGARQDSRGPVTGKSWTSGNTAKPRTQPKRPNSASSEPAIVGEGIIPKGHIGGRASPLETNSNGTISTPPPSPSAASSREKSITDDEPLKKTSPSPVKKKPPPLILSDSSVKQEKDLPPKSPKRALAKKSPPTPTGAKTPPARTPAATSPTKTPPGTSPVATPVEAPSGVSSAPNPSPPADKTSAEAPTPAPPVKTPSATPPKKSAAAKTPSGKSPKPVPKTPVKEEETTTMAGIGEKEKVTTPPPPPPPPPAAVCEVVPAEEEIVSSPPPCRPQDQQNKSERERELKKGDSMVKTVKRKLFGCLSPGHKSVSYG